MKRLHILNWCALIFIVGKSWGDAIPPHSLSLELGAIFPHAQLDTGPFGGGEQTIGDDGGIFGVRYLYASNPRIDLGVGLQHWETGQSEFTAAPFVGRMDMESTTLMAVVKIHPSTTNRFVPYFLGGLGLHYSEFNFDLEPVGRIVSDEKTGLAGTIGVGMDFNLTSRLFLALEGRLDVTSKEEYEATAEGRSSGIVHAEAAAANTALSFLIGFRFGNTDSPDAVEIPQPKQEPSKAEGAL